MSNSADAMNMGNAGGRSFDPRHFPENGWSEKNTNFLSQHVCQMRRENHLTYDGKKSGSFVTSVLAIILADFYPGLSAEKSVDLIENVDSQTNCSLLL